MGDEQALQPRERGEIMHPERDAFDPLVVGELIEMRHTREYFPDDPDEVLDADPGPVRRSQWKVEMVTPDGLNARISFVKWLELRS